MKYHYGSRRKALEYEKALIEQWKKDHTFLESINQRDSKNSYVFYDGPPFITGNPHHGTLLSSIVKDAVPRFWTMRGKRVERKWGWDCHGLPAENFVEKQLGITDRREIGTKWSLAEYITKARESMVANSETWESTIDRVGRWVDFSGAYRTMDKEFMESVWWAFKTLYDKGKIYEGRKVLMYDTKFATPVSKAEVTMDNDAYQTVTDPSVFVKFKLASQDAYLLAWTTTPWTLPANILLAVNPSLRYGLYQVESEQFILAEILADQVLGTNHSQPLKTFSGQELVGQKYLPLFDVQSQFDELLPDTWTVVAGDFVSDSDGTGIVHCAPAYGEDDYELFQRHQANFLDVLDENGYYLPAIANLLHDLGVRNTDSHGIEVWAGNKFIAKCLEATGKIWKIAYIQHEYPFNPRSKQRIIYRAFPSWFFDVNGMKKELIAQNQKINWFPAYLKEGRFKKNIEQAPDWNLSRDRFWATAMPVWKGDKGTVKVVGSYEELYQLSGVRLEDYHRPWVDEITFDIDGEHFVRVDKVLDCWFESGSMPFAQLHYPFENKAKFEQNYPADFIVEYVGQVRAWFYYVHVVNTALFGAPAYKNVITTGTLAGNDGRKMSKSLGNYTDPNELMDKYSADALRFLLLSSPVLSGEDFALLDKDVSDVARKLAMLWNVYDFFTMYAEVDHFESDPAMMNIELSQLKNPLDIWIVSRVHQLRDEITTGMEEYNLPKALSGVLDCIDDLSNWYVRRSRRRFWKSEDDTDKNLAYQTLFYVLVYFSQILAPFTPFLADELFRLMTGEKSVHLQDWPAHGAQDQAVLDYMNATRTIITDGLALRMRRSETEEQVKIRQPLASLTYVYTTRLPHFYENIIAEEVNVKQVRFGKALSLDKHITPELAAEGFARELIRHIQSLRKKSGLNIDDRIKLAVRCPIALSPDLQKLIATEVLATQACFDAQNTENYQFDEIVSVGSNSVVVSLEKTLS